VVHNHKVHHLSFWQFHLALYLTGSQKENQNDTFPQTTRIGNLSFVYFESHCHMEFGGSNDDSDNDKNNICINNNINLVKTFVTKLVSTLT